MSRRTGMVVDRSRPCRRGHPPGKHARYPTGECRACANASKTKWRKKKPRLGSFEATEETVRRIVSGAELDEVRLANWVPPWRGKTNKPPGWLLTLRRDGFVVAVRCFPFSLVSEFEVRARKAVEALT